MADLNDIFSDEEETLSDDELLKYLDASTPDAEKHAIEKKLADSAFANEAVEGLQHFNSKKKLDDYVQQLNKNLQKELATKKYRKQKRTIKELPLIIVTVVIILLLCVLGYMVIHLYQKHERTSPADTKQTTSLHRANTIEGKV
jgi:CHASE3 domain sensor protein